MSKVKCVTRDPEVLEVADGEQVLSATAVHRPDVILMDIQLPLLVRRKIPLVVSRDQRRRLLAVASSLKLRVL